MSSLISAGIVISLVALGLVGVSAGIGRPVSIGMVACLERLGLVSVSAEFA